MSERLDGPKNVYIPPGARCEYRCESPTTVSVTEAPPTELFPPAHIMLDIFAVLGFMYLCIRALQHSDAIARAWRRSEIKIPWKSAFDALFAVALVLWIIVAMKGLFS